MSTAFSAFTASLRHHVAEHHYWFVDGYSPPATPSVLFGGLRLSLFFIFSFFPPIPGLLYRQKMTAIIEQPLRFA